MGEQWYTNKDLFELINNMQGDFKNLRSEMRETRIMIKQYNGLREEIGETKKEVQEVKDKVENIESRGQGKKAVFDGIVKYGGWIIAILTMLSGYLKLFF